MKAILIAVSSLALAGAVWAQTEPSGADVAKEASDLARVVKDKASEAAGDAAEAVQHGAAAAVDSASDAAKSAAEKAGQAVEAAGQAVEQLGKDVQENQPGDAVEEATGKKAVITATETAVDVINVTPPDVKAPAITVDKPGILGSWILKRRIWTTNDSNVTPWTEGKLAERPPTWADIAKIDDVVLDENGHVVGYLADIGGFLGIGVKKVLLGIEAIHPMKVHDDWIFVTNFTKSELEALPNFDAATVLK